MNLRISLKSNLVKATISYFIDGDDFKESANIARSYPHEKQLITPGSPYYISFDQRRGFSFIVSTGKMFTTITLGQRIPYDDTGNIYVIDPWRTDNANDN